MSDSTYDPAFAFLSTPTGRSVHKPRRTGLSSVLDYGVSLGAVRDLLELDIDHLVIEGAELLGDNGEGAELIERLKSRLDVTKVVFELPVLSINGWGTPETEAIKRVLVQAFGPDVNLGNLSPEEIIQTEVVRMGMEDPSWWPE